MWIKVGKEIKTTLPGYVGRQNERERKKERKREREREWSRKPSENIFTWILLIFLSTLQWNIFFCFPQLQQSLWFTTLNVVNDTS